MPALGSDQDDDGDLRGILSGLNVGGRTVTNDRLRELLEDLGFVGVTPFLASGNVLFEAADTIDTASLEGRIESQLCEGLGFAVPAFVRSAKEVIDTANHEPFADVPVRSRRS